MPQDSENERVRERRNGCDFVVCGSLAAPALRRLDGAGSRWVRVFGAVRLFRVLAIPDRSLDDGRDADHGCPDPATTSERRTSRIFPPPSTAGPIRAPLPPRVRTDRSRPVPWRRMRGGYGRATGAGIGFCGWGRRTMAGVTVRHLRWLSHHLRHLSTSTGSPRGGPRLRMLQLWSVTATISESA